MQLQGVAYIPKDEDVQHVFHSNFSDMSKQNAATTTTKHLNSMLDCACQYHCSKAFYLLSIITAGPRIVINQAIDAPGYIRLSELKPGVDIFLHVTKHPLYLYFPALLYSAGGMYRLLIHHIIISIHVHSFARLITCIYKTYGLLPT